MTPSSTTSAASPPLPPVYYALRTRSPLHINIDGDILNKPVWQDVPWSEPFGEIRGSDAPHEDTPEYHQCVTRIKMLWDDDFLYIAALLEYGVSTLKSDVDDEGRANGKQAKDDIVTDIVASYTERNSPIFHQDSDLEVFLDVDGSCHNYKELEMNAWNTVWNLMLDKPYMDGGQEHSARVTSDTNDPLYYEVSRQITATKLIKGSINGNSHNAHVQNIWAVEIALPHNESRKYTRPFGQENIPPVIGETWRINFSRVEKKGRINWTWAPQITWNPKEKKFSGIVNMHAPESWGYVYFTNHEALLKLQAESSHMTSWKLLQSAMACYYALHNFKEENNIFTDDILQLSLPSEDFFYDQVIEIFPDNANHTFTVIVSDSHNTHSVKVTHDRKVTYLTNVTDSIK